MLTVVVDVAYTAGGAVKILETYYEQALRQSADEWVFITGNHALEDAPNVRCIRLPKAASSWCGRLLAEFVTIPRLIRSLKADRVLSLQNVAIPFVKCEQQVYLQQGIPFTEYAVPFSQHKRLWFYQNPYKQYLKYNLRWADSIIVQTEWMKAQCAAHTGIPLDRIRVEKPLVTLPSPQAVPDDGTARFFFPASSYFYKNHAVIERAVTLFERQFPDKEIELVLTLAGTENEALRKLAARPPDSNVSVRWVGWLDSQQMNAYYASSVLLFPSYIESLGLPVMEARAMGRPVIAADCLYAREVLDGYQDCDFFPPHDEQALCALLDRYSTNRDLKRNAR